MSEVTDGEAAGACGCGEVVPQVGEEDGERGFMELNLPGYYVYGCLRQPTHMVSYLYLVILHPPLSYQVEMVSAFCLARS